MNSNKVLLQIGLAIALGIASGYLVALQFGIIAGVLMGTLLAFFIADVKGAWHEISVMRSEIKNGLHGNKITQDKDEKRGAEMTFFFQMLLFILFVTTIPFCMFTIPALFVQIYEPSSGLLSAHASILAWYATGVVFLILGAEILDLPSTRKSLVEFPLLRMITSLGDDSDTTDKNPKSSKHATEYSHELWAHRYSDGKRIHFSRLFGMLMVIIGLSLLPIVSTLCIVFFLVSLVVLLLDTFITLFFKITNSRNMAAGITTFLGILLEYAFFPTMGLSLGGIVRFAAFAIGGAIIGVLLYHWRTHLILRQTAEELALAS